MSVNLPIWDLVLRSPSEYFDGTTFQDGRDLIIAICGEYIDYIGTDQSPSRYGKNTVVVDCTNRTVTPGLIDCHTHLVFGGDRSNEFSMRASGASYEDLLAAGGGIHHTVEATRHASKYELETETRRRLDTMLSYGVTTIEIKSGYGLDIENELKILEVVASLSDHPVDCIGTCLAAHIVPKTFKDRPSAYLDLIIDQLLPILAERNLCEFVDIFIENNAFTVADGRRLFEAARALGFGTKVHSEQLSYQGSVELACEFGSASADHLEFVSDDGIKALAQSQTTAVLLPTCNLFLQQDAKAPARRLIDAGCTVALSTDCNPGSSMVENILLTMSLGMTQLGMTSDEVWRAVTLGGAAALAKKDRGHLAVGRIADIAVFDCPRGVHVPYRMGSMSAHSVFKSGKQVL